ncbi:MAG TPA: four helix bundle protein [Planctomycetota bacterium]|nr:four helix bundle protein [Planctomycetota bacterium]
MVDLKQRTKKFAIDVIRFCSTLPRRREFDIIAGQLTRSATSLGANYRAALRGRSSKEFIAKLGICEEEADESLYWLELLEALATKEHSELTRLMDEANQLVAIIVASKKRARVPDRAVL